MVLWLIPCVINLTGKIDFRDKGRAENEFE